MDAPYVPISCSVHDELLARATLRRECEIVYAQEGGGTARVRGVIADVYSRGGAEWLELRGGTTLRLDRLRELDGIPVPPPAC